MGANEQLRRLAQGIIVEQQQEIAAMRVALGDVTLPPSGAICTSPFCLAVSSGTGGAGNS